MVNPIGSQYPKTRPFRQMAYIGVLERRQDIDLVDKTGEYICVQIGRLWYWSQIIGTVTKPSGSQFSKSCVFFIQVAYVAVV